MEVNCSQPTQRRRQTDRQTDNLFHTLGSICQARRAGSGFLASVSALSDYNTINCAWGLSRLRCCRSFINEVPKLGLVAGTGCAWAWARALATTCSGQPVQVDATSSLVALNAGGDCNLWPDKRRSASRLQCPWLTSQVGQQAPPNWTCLHALHRQKVLGYATIPVSRPCSHDPIFRQAYLKLANVCHLI